MSDACLWLGPMLLNLWFALALTVCELAAIFLFHHSMLSDLMIHWSSYELNKFCILTTAESMAVKSVNETVRMRRIIYAMSTPVLFA